MPLTKAHKQESRQKILLCATRMFAEQGFDGVSIDNVMQEAGMTRGAFYAHFQSKEDLYAHAIKAGAQSSGIVKALAGGMRGDELLKNVIDSYLSVQHTRGKSPCMLAFLATDVANKNENIRQVYTEVFDRLMKAMAKEAPKDSAAVSQDRILAVGAIMIGGVAVGRALTDSELSEKMLLRCRELAHELLC